MASNYIYEPYIHKQISSVSTLTLEHNFGRDVNVQVHKNQTQTGGVIQIIYPKVSIIDKNTILIEFIEHDDLININNFTVIIS